MGSPFGINYEEPEYEPLDLSAEIAASEERKRNPRPRPPQYVPVPPDKSGWMDRQARGDKPLWQRTGGKERQAAMDLNAAEDRRFKNEMELYGADQADRRINAPGERQRPNWQVEQVKGGYRTYDRNSDTPPDFGDAEPYEKPVTPDRSRSQWEDMVDKFGVEGAMRMQTQQHIDQQRPLQPRAPSRKIPMTNDEGRAGLVDPDTGVWEPIQGGHGLTRPGGPPKAPNPSKTPVDEFGEPVPEEKYQIPSGENFRKSLQGDGGNARQYGDATPKSAPAEQTFKPNWKYRINGKEVTTDANGQIVQ